MTLAELNNISQAEAFNVFEKCCTSNAWINQMVDSLPFPSIEKVKAEAEHAWSTTSLTDWLEACDGHPKIGDVSSLKKKYAATGDVASKEQIGMDSANDEVIQRLTEGNAAYEDKFGYIFIVCATGKSALEMLKLLESRLVNNEEDELEIAKGEQNKITLLRIDNLLQN